jgi:hypothetical protein
MKPTQLKSGDRIILTLSLGSGEVEAIFVRREPSRGRGFPAVNYIRIPDHAGLNGAADDGACTLSDYELSRNGRLAAGE